MFGMAGLVIGILLLLFGAFMIFGFPAAEEHQPPSFSWAAIVIGFIVAIIGAVLVFV